MNEVRASNYPQMYIDLGIDVQNLGCIMLDTEPIVISDMIPTSYYYYADPDLQPYVQGNVSESVPHCTLLHGLMQSGKTMFKHVDAVLKGWEPTEVTIDSVGFFYSDGADYVTVIALLKVDDQLTNAHQRLSLLPHINTFGEYHPHITLAYLKSTSEWEPVVEQLNEKFSGTTVKPIAVNYGD